MTTLVKKDRGRDADAAADATPAWSAPGLPRATVRGAGYTLVLTLAAGWLIFHDLGAARMEGDEALYALLTDQIHRTGEWLTPAVRPGQPYLNKPPLYLWLSAATYDLVPGFAEKYRFWSAAAGVGCVAMTCLLGWVLFGPEVGAVAGALLLTNRRFLLEHGARTGTMDTGLTLLMASALVLYALVAAGRIRWAGWVGIGIAAGLACLLKPFFGVPMLLTIGAAALVARGRLPAAAVVRGMGVAVVVMLIVGGPWYVFQWRRHGAVFTEAMRTQVVRRATTGLNPEETSTDPLYYVAGDRSVSASSTPFLFVVPALLFSAAAAVRTSARRQAYAVLAVVGIVWLVGISWSKGKFLHYAYPAFPAFSVALAAMFVSTFTFAVRRIILDPARGDWWNAAGFSVAAVAVAFACARLAYQDLERHKRYVPWQVYQTFRPAIAEGRARLVVCDLPLTPEEDDGSRGLLPSELLYLSHMQAATRAADLEEVERLLETRTPTLLLSSKRQKPSQLLAKAQAAARADERFTEEQTATTIMVLDADPLLRPRLSDGSAAPYVELVSGPNFKREFVVRVKPPLPEDFLVVVTVRRSAGVASEAVRCETDDGRSRADGRIAVPFTTTARLMADVRSDLKRPSTPREVRFSLTSADPRHAGEEIRGVVEDVQVIVQPRLPVENPARYFR